MTRRKKNNVLDFAVKKLDDGKAENLTVLDIREKSSMADTIVIGTGTSSRHVMALAHNLVTELKKQDIRPLNDCHRGEGCWAVVDLGDVIIHLFTADARQEYNLEELWSEPKSKRTRKAPQKNA